MKSMFDHFRNKNATICYSYQLYQKVQNHCLLQSRRGFCTPVGTKVCNHLLQLLKGLVRKETVVIRRWGKGVGITRENLILSTELIIQIFHRKEFLKLTLRAIALRRFVPSSVSSFVPTKEQRQKRQFQKLSTVDNLQYQLS